MYWKEGQEDALHGLFLGLKSLVSNNDFQKRNNLHQSYPKNFQKQYMSYINSNKSEWKEKNYERHFLVKWWPLQVVFCSQVKQVKVI